MNSSGLVFAAAFLVTVPALADGARGVQSPQMGAVPQPPDPNAVQGYLQEVIRERDYAQQNAANLSAQLAQAQALIAKLQAQAKGPQK